MRSLKGRFLLWLLAAWAGNCLGLLLAAALLPAVGYGEGLGTLLLAGAILGLVNLALRPVVVLMTLPAVILSLGFALLFINAFMLWITSHIVSGLTVGGFFSTLAAAAVIWIANWALRSWRAERTQARARTPRFQPPIQRR